MLNRGCKENQIHWTGVLDHCTAKLVLGQDYWSTNSLVTQNYVALYDQHKLDRLLHL